MFKAVWATGKKSQSSPKRKSNIKVTATKMLLEAPQLQKSMLVLMLQHSFSSMRILMIFFLMRRPFLLMRLSWMGTQEDQKTFIAAQVDLIGDVASKIATQLPE
jgi:hypothetical protein